MKRYFSLLLILAASLSACSSSDDDTRLPEQSDEPVTIAFDAQTRMTGGLADDGDAFTFMSYPVRNVAGTESTNPERLSSMDYRGYYMYDTGGSILVPVYVHPNTYVVTPTRNNAYGQRLNTGYYRTVILYPPIPVKSSMVASLGHMAVFKRTDDVYASYHDNVNLNDATARPFEILVERNLAVYDVPANTELYPTKSRITVHFFSSVGVNYQIPTGGLKLVWAGTEGWYNGYTGKTYPNYGTAGGSFVYDLSTPQEDNVNSFLPGSGTITLPAPTGGPYPEMYRIDDEPVFAADYTGNNDYVKPLTLRVELVMPISGGTSANMTSDIPLALNMERGKKYEFYVDVKSGGFQIWYSVKAWEDENGSDGSQDIGGIQYYDTIDFDFSGTGDWKPGNSGDGPSDIG